ncbi:MAG: hypothetical protein PHN31_04740 [Candidatus Gracilibacteria bacterium]|nr:hypothetical protein [Candidatus Gracilibacteria bacterium]
MSFEIFTFKKDNSFISFSPSRGGIITQINLNGKDLLFLNKETFEDNTKNVRGGIPVLFPNAGPLKENNLYNLSQHGFARNSIWGYVIEQDKFSMIFSSNDDTKTKYNYDLKLEIIGEIIENKVLITQKITNTGKINLPISCGLHPYFYVKNEDKENIVFSSQEDNFYDIWSIGGTKVLDNKGSFYVDFNDDYKLKIDYDLNYKNIWIRSEEGKDFICIEPVLRNENGLLDNPFIVEAGKSVEFKIVYEIISK